MDDLAVILVSHSQAAWLRPCLQSVFASAGTATIDVVVVSNGDDGSAEIVEGEFPAVRSLRTENRGFAHANNVGLASTDARYVLFLNVDTEVLEGTFGDLVAALDARAEVGVAGVRQVDGAGAVAPTIRRFPSPVRSLAEAFGAERFPIRARWLGERELDRRAYASERSCDWVSGSFLVVRRAVLEDVGSLDDRFFLYSEEPDLCLRARERGWDVRYLPVMTIVHHHEDTPLTPILAAQDAFARLQFARKHFAAVTRVAYRASLGVGYAIRAVSPGSGRAARRRSARSALRVVLGRAGSPFATEGGRSLGPRTQQ
ncbi:MAG TPA: glycosyltransferase family 2 protein [Gaiellaceae bacterium]|nr:glycosyltransferase family 2 protein [Gaiellaceae bacterium]